MKALVMMIVSVVMLRTCNTPSINYAPPTPVSFQQFYDELSPYGNWVQTPDLGYAWVPDVDEGFRPYYTNGNWVATDVGNTWVSDYPWGWAPFHYGNWAYTDPYGWAWKPGYDWAPAHVSWRQGDGFYGWAPLLANLALNKLLYDDDRPDDWWVFVPQNRLYDRNVYRYWPGPQFSQGLLPNTSYITNVYKSKGGNTYYFGPQPGEFTRLTGKSVKVRNVVDVSRSGFAGKKNNALHVYRPAVKQDKMARPSPDKVMQSWSGKGRGSKPANIKTDDRGSKQLDKAPSIKQNERGSKQLDKASPAAKQKQRGPDARGKQHVSPERKPSSPAKHTPRSAPARKEHKATAPVKTQRSAPARKETKARAPQQRSSSKPARENVRQSRPPAPRKQSQPAKQQRTQQRSQPRQQHQAQPAGGKGGQKGGQQQKGGQGGGGKKK